MKPVAATAQEVMAGLALVFMGLIALTLIFQIAPQANHDYLLIILGALGGAMGVTGGQRAAQMISGAQPVVNTTVPLETPTP